MVSNLWKVLVCVTDHKQTSHPLAYIECHSDSDSHAWPNLSHSSLIAWDISHIPIDFHTLRVTHPTLPYKEMCECFAWVIDGTPYFNMSLGLHTQGKFMRQKHVHLECAIIFSPCIATSWITIMSHVIYLLIRISSCCMLKAYMNYSICIRLIINLCWIQD